MAEDSMKAAPRRAGAGPQPWERRDAVLLALVSATLVLIAAQFALAGLGAFTMIRTPAAHAYGAHLVLGVIIGALAWVDLGAVVASAAARSRRRTLRLAAALALLAIPGEPLLAEAGKRVPAVGALHALTGLAICVLAGWLTAETARRRAAARRLIAGAPEPGGDARGSRAAAQGSGGDAQEPGSAAREPAADAREPR
jgi:4-amino-4-deoxy-L-arabinose transferase-like glycosyltransferase